MYAFTKCMHIHSVRTTMFKYDGFYDGSVSMLFLGFLMLVCIHFKCRQKRMPKRKQLIKVVSHVIWGTSYFSSGTQKTFYRKEICFKWLLFIFGKLYLSSPRSLPNKVAYSIHVITWKQKCAYMYSMNQVFLDLLVNFKLTSMHFKYFIDIRSEN